MWDFNKEFNPNYIPDWTDQDGPYEDEDCKDPYDDTDDRIDELLLEGD